MKPLLITPVQPQPDHEAGANEGNAVPLGTHERVTAAVGGTENITEATARYPRPGHKARRKPRLILKGLSTPAAAPETGQPGILRRLAQHVADTHRRLADHHRQMAARHAEEADGHCALEKAANGMVLWGE